LHSSQIIRASIGGSSDDTNELSGKNEPQIKIRRADKKAWRWSGEAQEKGRQVRAMTKRSLAAAVILLLIGILTARVDGIVPASLPPAQRKSPLFTCQEFARLPVTGL
jgi:hypothetical protein